ncbi:MAG: HNH endonuclease [Pleomorphochaeta sp.]
MNEITFKPIFEYDIFKDLNNLNFSEYYKSIHSYPFDLDEKNDEKYIEDRKHICTFCGKSLTKSNSQNKAHVIPALIKGVNLLSYEECSDCNHKFGEKYEQALGKFLNPILVLNKIPTRNKDTRIASKTEQEKIIFNKKNGITIKHKGLVNIDKNNGILNFSIFRKSFNGQYFLKSLLHTVWLIINEEERFQLEWIRKALTITNFKVPSKLYICQGGGYTNKLKVNIFKKIKEHENLSNYFLKMEIGNFLLYYSISYPYFKPILIDNIKINSNKIIVPEMILHDFDHKKNYPNEDIDVEFHFFKFQEGNSLELKNTKKDTESLVCLSVNKKRIIPKTLLIHYNNGSFKISGLDFCGEIFFESKKFKVDFETQDKNILNLKKTIDFIREINNIKSFEIVELENDNIITTTQDIECSTNEELFIYIDNLYTIATKLNRIIYFKKDSTKIDKMNAQNLVDLINGKKLNDFGAFSRPGDLKYIDEYYAEFKNKKEYFDQYPNEELQIMHYKFQLNDSFIRHFKNIEEVIKYDDRIFIKSKIYSKIKLNKDSKKFK